MALPKGIILLWYGSVANIPGGWHLCDGTAGTPDLRDRFIIGAGDTYDPDDSGGASTHLHTGTTDGHFHTFVAGTGIAAGTDFNPQTHTKTDTFTTAAANHLPPYYALCYIMRV